MNQKQSIILTTLNASYPHTALGLRYIFANMKDLQDQTGIEEFIIKDQVSDIAEKLLQENPTLIGIGVYIWNAKQVQRLIVLLKQLSPETLIVLGGPEVSHNPIRIKIDSADYIIQGEADLAFYHLCKSILEGNAPTQQTIKAQVPDVNILKLPYHYYSDEDIKNRTIYMEASRGCPFQCEFCLSSIDKEVRYFDIKLILNNLEQLWDKGARKFKFIDRSMNIAPEKLDPIFDFFLNQDKSCFIHLEMIPDLLTDKLKTKLKQFPPASLQLEIGIQTINSETSSRIHRPLDLESIHNNLIFLENETQAHLHLDLIIGLPGESIDQFEENLNQLISWTSGEIQLGILKKLSGTTINRHDVTFKMIYSEVPPYEIMQTNLITFSQMQHMKRFARLWDMVYNRGNFNTTVQLLWKTQTPFKGFNAFTYWVEHQTNEFQHVSLNRLAEYLFQYLTESSQWDEKTVANTIAKDMLTIQGRKLPQLIREHVDNDILIEHKKLDKINARQLRHL